MTAFTRGYACLIKHLTVDKVIISQESLLSFINAVSPGAYTSITKVDFKALDQFMIKPLGVYGSKDEIVSLLQSIDAVDENMCVCCLLNVSAYESFRTQSGVAPCSK